MQRNTNSIHKSGEGDPLPSQHKGGSMVQDHIKREYAIRAIRGEGTRELYETFPKGHYVDFASFKRALMKWKAKHTPFAA